jgi:hypothetical protein
LRVAGRLEPPHRPFLLPGGLMRVFGAVIQVAMLPMILLLGVNRQEHFIQVPRVTSSGAAPAKPIGGGLSKLPAPISYRFMRHRDTAFSHELFDIAVTEGKAVVQPHTVANDLRRKPMTLIQVGSRWWVHAVSMPHPAEAVKAQRLT